jgi:hypothetical protein
MIALDLKDEITLAVALLGAGLGIFNTLYSINQRKMNLRVIPKYAENFLSRMSSSSQAKGKDGDLYNQWGCIEVINLSAFPVTLAEIGFTYSGDHRKKTLCMIGEPGTTDGIPLRRRLESREAVTGYFLLNVIKPGVQKAYAHTDCGKVGYGTSAALKEIQRRV